MGYLRSFGLCAVLMLSTPFALSLQSCTQTKFSGKKAPAPVDGDAVKPSGLPSTLQPGEFDANAKKKVCSGSHQATRMVFMMDNSGSHQARSSTGAIIGGSDPTTTGVSPRGITEPFTQRQNAVYSGIFKTADLDLTSAKTNPDFVGSDVGVVFFPRGEATREDSETFGQVSGPGGLGQAALPAPMTNLKSVAGAPNFRENLWKSFDFTHDPKGITPYLAALQGAKSLLDATRKPASEDPRKEIVFLITDGLPTDQSPRQVMDFAQSEFRQKGISVITIFVFKPTDNQKIEDSPAYQSLQTAYNDSRQWGHVDNYKSFADYWTALTAIPKGISDYYVEVPDAAQLQSEIEKILQVVQVCK